jgi:hypothetical protein
VWYLNGRILYATDTCLGCNGSSQCDTRIGTSSVFDFAHSGRFVVSPHSDHAQISLTLNVLGRILGAQSTSRTGLLEIGGSLEAGVRCMGAANVHEQARLRLRTRCGFSIKPQGLST